jgi:hypothetical protein
VTWERSFKDTIHLFCNLQNLSPQHPNLAQAHAENLKKTQEKKKNIRAKRRKKGKKIGHQSKHLTMPFQHYTRKQFS